MANHDDLSLDELKALLETRLNEFLNRRPAPFEILDLVLQFMQVIQFSLHDAALEHKVDEDMNREGYFLNERGQYVKDDRISTDKGGDTDEGKDG
ncbi:hypothetical protein ES702_06250 [subsurface metagenome]